MKKIQNYWSKLVESIIESRKEYAAHKVAVHLTETNPDFRYASVYDLKQKIMEGDFRPSELLKEIKH